MAPQNMYCLRIVRAIGLRSATSSTPGEAPSPYVEVSFGGFRGRTRVVKSNASPSWDETVQLPAAVLTTTLSIKVIHESSFRDEPLAGISVAIDTLLGMDKAHNRDITLKLQRLKNSRTSGTNDTGSIVIQLSVENTSDGPQADAPQIGSMAIDPTAPSALPEMEMTDTVVPDLSFLDNDTTQHIVEWLSSHLDIKVEANELRQFLSEEYSILCEVAVGLDGVIPFDKSLRLYEAALRLTGLNDPNRPKLLGGLGGTCHDNFTHLGGIAHLKDAIAYLQEAVQITPETHPDLPEYLTILGLSLWKNFKQLGDIGDLNQAILYNQQAVDTAPETSLNFPKYLSNLGLSFQTRFKQLGDIADLNKAIQHSQQAVDTIQKTHKTHPDLPQYLNNLVLSFTTRFDQLGDMADLNNAIQHYQQAVDTTKKRQPGLPLYLNDLGLSFRTRFDQLRDMADLNKAILHFQQAVDITQKIHPELPMYLNDLALSLQTRFTDLGDIADLNKAIQCNQQAVDSTPETHSNFPILLNNLGMSFQTRFKQLGDIADLNKAIQYHQQTVDTTPETHSDFSSFLNRLGFSFRTRFEQLGDIADLNKAILQYQQAVDNTPKTHPDLSFYRNNLGISFHLRFKQLGDIADLDEAILYHQQAVDSTPETHPHFLSYQNSLGLSLRSHFEQLGNIADLNKAILYHQQAVDSTSETHPHFPSYLSSHGLSFWLRFQQLGDIADLNKAILYHQQAVDSTSEMHSHFSSYLNNLGLSFWRSFKELGDIADLNKAILHIQQAVDTTPETHLHFSLYLNSLGILFWSRFEQLGDIADLNKAILHYQQAVDTTSETHPHFSMYLHSLGLSFMSRFERLGDIADLNKAILLNKQAVDSTPETHYHFSSYLNSLGLLFMSRFEQLGDIADLQKAITSSSNAAQLIGKPSICLTAALNWAHYAGNLEEEDKMSSLCKAYNCAIDLLPQLAWMGHNIGLRYDQLTLAKSVACDAAAVSLNVSNATQALEWLETGRSIVWGQNLQLHTPFDDLNKANPLSAKKLKQLSVTLEHEASETIEEYHTAAQEWNEIVKDVRKMPGFSQFLLPKQYSEISQVSCLGTVVVVNVSIHRCDALIIQSPLEPPLHVPLHKFSHMQAQNLQIRLQSILTKLGLYNRGDDIPIRAGRPVSVDIDEAFRAILADLWTNVVKPILDGLSLKPLPPNNLPRIWWCPTGPLSFLPLHAAGIYPVKEESQICLADFAVSSYTPTLTALLAALQKSSTEVKEAVHLLAVIQPNTPELSALPGTREELKIIQNWSANHQPEILTTLEGEKATVVEVLSEMSNCSWVHLACHGKQDLEEPAKSGFFLQDGCLELSKIVSKSLANARFAFLSACQTATGSTEQPDEAIHLAAGMLSAGYQSVIATMWSIGDNDAPFIAEAVYSKFLGGEVPSSKDAAYALHDAVKSLRESYGSRSFASWVPYIHMGV